ncbi:unnamed protein product [Acanthoscelides obtectus]|uniref:Midasin n=1 Tax=Acanthoscelides obtectus TaxID=200917 RepID=A0A9P0MA00_ACAOB|nr:unnamed protein product [Acanthoscelides obtectus]CAK1678369.1 Midasin [Acanthoscelides obtectus]
MSSGMMDRTRRLSLSLSNFSKINEQFRVVFEHVSKNIQLKSENKEDCLLNYIALELLVIPQYYDTIQQYFSEEFTLLVDKAVNCKEISNFRHILNCILLGNVVKNRNDLQGYALRYFSAHQSPFEIREDQTSKRRKMQQNINIEDIDIVESSLFLLRSNPDFYRAKWNWSSFIKKFFNHKEAKVIWIACHTLAVLFGMNEYQLNNVILSKISEELHRNYSYLFYTNQTLKEGDVAPPGIDQSPVVPKQQIQSKVVNVSGIYIPSFHTSVDYEQNLVVVHSTYNNLRKIALGLASGKAIMLQGSVGSGKTCLVEYLAAKTGRKLGENFLKIQLGDETDSKMLLGTYRCTDVPGEFVWQPGVLTQAVVEGSWLLLEDIDSASMDIASIITSLLENGCLTVPGYKDSVPITPGFQLFLTQRLIPTLSGYHKKHSNTMTLLGKSAFLITVDPLSSSELKQILDSQFPQFKTIADRMISVFLLFVPKTLDGDGGQISVPRSGRLISTRDFFKWCSRAVIDFDVQSQASALKVLQDAIDVFCCSFSNTNEALELAKQISTNLGIVNQKAEYFFKTYKPAMHLTTDSLVAGRVMLKKENNEYTRQTKYSFTRPSAVLLERIMCCVSLREPVLLVGETGTGKTSCVQFLAHTLGKRLIVINMNQQSDSADLLGGFKPVDLKYVIAPVRREFEAVFSDYFKVEPNRKYLANIALCFNNQRWGDLLKLINKSYEAALSRLTKSIQDFEANKVQDHEKRKQYEKNKTFLERWQCLGEKLHKLGVQLKQKSALAFAFIEGSLVKAVENGYWVLLDEINLANAETLECLSGLLEGSEGSLCLLERG